MNHYSLTLAPVMYLADCGGASTGGYDGPAITPLSDSGFAAASSVVATGGTFNTPNTARFLGTSEGTITLDQQSVVVAIPSNGESVTVEIDGTSYTLANASRGDYRFSDQTSDVLLRRIDASVPEAEVVYARTIIDNSLNASMFVIGYDTDPNAVARQSGTARMNGTIFISARNGFNLSGYDGPAAIDVDFDAMKIGGTFTLSGTGTGLTDIVTGTSEFTFAETDIVGNGFEGTFFLSEGALNGILVDPVFSGRLFGSDAQTAGGQLSGTVTVGRDVEPTYVVGAFTASEQE